MRPPSNIRQVTGDWHSASGFGGSVKEYRLGKRQVIAIRTSSSKRLRPPASIGEAPGLLRRESRTICSPPSLSSQTLEATPCQQSRLFLHHHAPRESIEGHRLAHDAPCLGADSGRVGPCRRRALLGPVGGQFGHACEEARAETRHLRGCRRHSYPGVNGSLFGQGAQDPGPALCGHGLRLGHCSCRPAWGRRGRAFGDVARCRSLGMYTSPGVDRHDGPVSCPGVLILLSAEHATVPGLGDCLG